MGCSLSTAGIQQTGPGAGPHMRYVHHLAQVNDWIFDDYSGQMAVMPIMQCHAHSCNAELLL